MVRKICGIFVLFVMKNIQFYHNKYSDRLLQVIELNRLFMAPLNRSINYGFKRFDLGVVQSK